jgi:UDP-glucose 4-epimerase
MDYRGKTCLVTGSDGFIGQKLAIALEAMGVVKVNKSTTDIRNISLLEEEFSHNIDYVFHFASPSSQMQFKKNVDYCVDTTINGFLNISRLCKKYNAKLIYPSTGLVSQNRYNEYARCKKILEDIHLGMNLDALGLRIFASYGENENHKRDYASPIYLFARDLVYKKRPVIWGDGTQTRDFIHIDDLVRNILILAEDCNERIMEVGSGESHSFNEIIEVANDYLSQSISPVYIGKPAEYYDNTLCNVTKLLDYCPPINVSFKEGVQRICENVSSLLP